MTEPIYIGSLFSGIGGIEIGFERAGFETRWFIENDRYAQKILKKNWPDTLIYDDITKIDFAAVPKIDILTGGFPCQDISSAGKGTGITGSRSSLWKYYIKAIRILRPKIAFIENVPMLTRRGLNVVLADLAKNGYDAEWYNLSASSVGAFHKRERLFIIAYLPIKRKRKLPVLKRNQGKKNINFNRQDKTEVTDSTSTGEMSAKQQGPGDGTIKICKDAAITASNRCREMPKRQSNKNNSTGTEKIIQEEISNSDSKRCEEQRRSKPKEKTRTRSKYNSENADSDQIMLWKLGSLQRNSDGLTETESGICGVVDGIPHRVDRIKCLGNAVVPQVAEVFAQAIKERWFENNEKET